jgi:hypothetical protein
VSLIIHYQCKLPWRFLLPLRRCFVEWRGDDLVYGVLGNDRLTRRSVAPMATTHMGMHQMVVSVISWPISTQEVSLAAQSYWTHFKQN